jgi:hypothetical protein
MQVWEYKYLSREQWNKLITEKMEIKPKFTFNKKFNNKFIQDREKASQAVLDEIGNEGWELTSSIPIFVMIFGSGRTQGCDLVFKRPKAT